jgi:phosphate-selective porin OprO and OprP
MGRRRTAQANSALLASSSCILQLSKNPLRANAQSPSRERGVGAGPSTHKRRRPEVAAWALGAAISLSPASSAFAADDLATQVRILTERLNATTERLNATDNEVRSLKAQLKQYQNKSVKADKKQKEASKESPDKGKGKDSGKTAAVTTPPLPFYIDLSRGLRIESEDKLNLFKIGGRLYIDGGISTQPEKGVESIANIRQLRLDVEGRVKKYWEYRFQYEFAAGNTSNVGTLGGVRDAFIANTYFEPVVFQVGQMFEPYGLEGSKSTNYIDFLEKSLATETFAPSHHVGLAVLATGDVWSAKGGVFSTSTLDGAFVPQPGTPVPWWVNPKAGWVATGGAQYFDASGRLTLALIKEDDRLLHIGGSGRYHKPNDSTASNDGRVLQLGANTQMESNDVKENLLGTPDLSCGSVGVFGNPVVAGKCTHDVVSWGAEAVAAYGPASVQAEYFGSHYSRDPGAILEANTLGGYYAPGGSTYEASGFYVYGTFYLTGETRASAYRVKALNPANFGQIKILDPVSKGGWGAWELTLRYSELNLNNGPYQGTYFANLVALAPTTATRTYFANSGVLGGREENMTLGVNWYPDVGFRLMANWIRVLELSAPWNRAYLNNAHPNTVILRAQVDW